MPEKKEKVDLCIIASLLLSNVFKESNYIGSLLRFLQARKGHLRPRNVLFRVLEIFE